MLINQSKATMLQIEQFIYRYLWFNARGETAHKILTLWDAFVKLAYKWRREYVRSL
jgi:hypothetical protein